MYEEAEVKLQIIPIGVPRYCVQIFSPTLLYVIVCRIDLHT